MEKAFQFCEMSAMVTNCVIDPPRFFGSLLHYVDGIFTTHLYRPGGFHHVGCFLSYYVKVTD